MICGLFDGLTPVEILAANDDLLRQTGLWKELTPNRRSGLSRLLERIRQFAERQASP